MFNPRFSSTTRSFAMNILTLDAESWMLACASSRVMLLFSMKCRKMSFVPLASLRMGTPPSTGPATGPGRVGKRVDSSGRVCVCGVVVGGGSVLDTVGNDGGVAFAVAVAVVVVTAAAVVGIVAVVVVVNVWVLISGVVVVMVVVMAEVSVVGAVGILILPFHMSMTDGHGSSPCTLSHTLPQPPLLIGGVSATLTEMYSVLSLVAPEIIHFPEPLKAMASSAGRGRVSMNSGE